MRSYYFLNFFYLFIVFFLQFYVFLFELVRIQQKNFSLKGLLFNLRQALQKPPLTSLIFFSGYFLLIIPFSGIFFKSPLLSKVVIPKFILEFLLQQPLYLFLVSTFYLLVFILSIRMIFVLPLMFFQKLTLHEALKLSFTLTKKRFSKILISFTLILFLGSNAFYFIDTRYELPVIISHRGVDNENGVQNTLPALRKTAALKPDLIEIDIRETKDHKFVVMHDTNLKKLAGIDISSQKLTLAQLTKITVFENGHQAKIASFDSYLKVAQNYQQKLLIDASIPIYYTLPYNFIFPHTPADGYSMEQSTLNDSFVTQAKLSSKQVYSWTPNTEDEFTKAMFLNVDGMITENVSGVKAYYRSLLQDPSYASRLLEYSVLLPDQF
ncbi:MAG: hypothetical protein HDT50_05095 [Lactobacillus sp.]|nr:hypothetical protein [Lactobacillus sp.]